MQVIDVPISDIEREACLRVARGRNDEKVALNVRNDRYSEKQDLRIHFEGVMGEYATAKLIGAAVDKTISLGGDDGRNDLRLSDGKTITVKTRGFSTGRDFALSTDNPADFKDDYGVLAWMSEDEQKVTVVGWITREDFIKNAQRKYLKGWRLLVEPDQLSDIRGFILHVNSVRARKALLEN